MKYNFKKLEVISNIESYMIYNIIYTQYYIIISNKMIRITYIVK